jgi:outer membrane protein TolC
VNRPFLGALLAVAVLSDAFPVVRAETSEYPAELPPPARVRAAIADAPEVSEAASLVEAAQAERRRLAVGPHEWTTSAQYQRRRVREVGTSERFNEWSVALERGIRLPGKAELDRRLGAERIDEAGLALADAQHESSRRLLARWYGYLRGRESAQFLERQAQLAAREAQAVSRRRQLGDASRLDEVQAAAEAEQVEAARRVAIDQAERARIALVREFPLMEGMASPETLPDPPELVEDPASLARSALEEDHGLRLARATAQLAQTEARRALADRRPDPTVGVQYATERNADERILGVFVSIPFGGDARRAAADASVARASALERRAEARRRQIDAQVAELVATARSGVARWQAAQRGAELQAQAAGRIARARELGETGLAEVLRARRLALDAALRAVNVRVDALESRARLLLDVHQIWDFESGP